ncbi:MAG: hypothetical protein KZQ58_06030 [gamma proteobacterium symbiont of Bathyaustriella thionipta]|nr:hypothetical protein [gamma proteobacterium symbiont of Bathyaustriella thionipta]
MLKLMASTVLVFTVLSGTVLADEDAASRSRGYKADKLEACVEPTEFMRRNHMELILHQRNLTVHEGIRIKDDSLANCVDCHASRDAQGKAIAVNEEGQFCERCHEQAAVHLDCFQCHATIPDSDIPNDSNWH